MKASYINDFESWSSEFTYAIPLTVRFSDVDMYGIVNNAVIISYLEYARIEYFKAIGLMGNWMDSEATIVPVIADIQCDYVKPIQYDENLAIYVKVETVGTSSIDIHYLGKNDAEEIVFTGRSTMVQINKGTGKGFPWSEEEKLIFVNGIGGKPSRPAKLSHILR
ncbi:acyl-CoA thioesterase [Sporosarcina ureilytica]|uniref:Acyl-CoA thioester hydrolase n=1 Tax=Sporosarcina ureilytica TaxID=298596 RepID=A0A1D8JF20_9BACL|nr:acyl-CoA thioesterase [Sporosarcina ureilytica]AOV07307.1 acyl-CoA thioester hydrolase [Sporosarcina ureilytica]